MFLGIDLGTTYSVGAYIKENGEPDVIVNCEGSRITPSVVYFEEANSIIVGQVAKDNCFIKPEDVVSTVKNYMGKKEIFKSSYGDEYTPEVISSFILRKIVVDANSYLNLEYPIKDVVITIPAYFTDAQRKATEDACKLAGLNLLAMINEPTAAALYYAYKTKSSQANILIYDLGGGTFDVTIIHIENDDITVKSTGGLSKVGGRFFDQNIVDYICDYMNDKYDIDLQDEEYLEDYQELFMKAEKCKIQLSAKDSSTISIKIGKIKETIDITREFLEQKVAKLYQRTEFVVKKAIRDAGLENSDINKVILVGGSSRIPFVEEKLGALIGIKPSKDVNPDEVVALGAALYGEHLMKEGQQKNIVDVCSHSIGIVTIDKVTGKKVNTIQIARNSSLPVDVTNHFRTMIDYQPAIELSVTEGEFEELSDVTVISTFIIDLPPNLKKGTKVAIRIQLDKNQLVHIYVKVDEGRLEKEFSIQRNANLSEDDLARYTGLVADYSIN
jgi:molecular chaperone DnaK